MKMQGMDFAIKDKATWFYQKANVAKSLTPLILSKERIKHNGKLQIFYDSTNAVCGTDNYIIKIYAPAICGYKPLNDLKREIYALERVQETSIYAPRLLSWGVIETTLSLYYCIIERISIPPASEYLLSCSKHELLVFGDKLKEALNILQTIEVCDTGLSKSSIKYTIGTFVHGDLTGSNVLFDGKNLAIIDFEDWQFTSALAELPAIVFEMIHNHIDIAPAFLGISKEDFRAKLSTGIEMHYASDRFKRIYTDFTEQLNLYGL